MHGVVPMCFPISVGMVAQFARVYPPGHRLGPQQDGAHSPPVGAVLAIPMPANLRASDYQKPARTVPVMTERPVVLAPTLLEGTHWCRTWAAVRVGKR
jgi:hypothetical protein